ncbi:mannose-6-phosphate isomerase, partial [Phenoliferia sp. Uapishka_3]
MAVALTRFSGFCGFRPPSQIASFISTVPEFSTILGSSVSSSFRSSFSPSSTPSEEEKKAGLKEMFSALMNADAEKVREEVKKLVERLEKESGEEGREERELIKTLNEDFEGDVGIFCTFVLNIVRLQPGEAVFLKADEPHAYLDGGASPSSPILSNHNQLTPLTTPPDIMECMATSDNVVRAGLTPKLRDVPTLTSMLTYTSSPPSEQILPPISYKSTTHTTLYDPPIDEFSVLLTDLPAGSTEKFEKIEGPSILIFTKLGGGARVSVGGENVEVEREGQVYFVGAGVEVVIEAKKGGLTAYRAFVEV